MAEKKECPECLEKINALIANKDSKFIEADRELLLTFDAPTLDKLAPTVVEVEKEVEKKVEVNVMSEDDKADIKWAREQRLARRNTMIKDIQDNTEKGTWTDDSFKEMTEDVLIKIHKSVKKESTVDYSLQNNIGNDTLQDNAGEVEAMCLGRDEFKKEEDK